MRRVMVHDDRQKLVPLYRFDRFGWPLWRTDELGHVPHPLYGEIRRRIAGGHSAFSILTIVVIGLVARLVLRYGLGSPSSVRAVVAGAAIGWGLVGLLILYAFWVALQQGKLRDPLLVANFLLTEGRCASCGFAIDWNRIEPDECVVCPECGAAWRAVWSADTEPKARLDRIVEGALP